MYYMIIKNRGLSKNVLLNEYTLYDIAKMTHTYESAGYEVELHHD
mgnify:CR=1 FL=1